MKEPSNFAFDAGDSAPCFLVFPWPVSHNLAVMPHETLGMSQ